jgi:hypothetical protein
MDKALTSSMGNYYGVIDAKIEGEIVQKSL